MLSSFLRQVLDGYFVHFVAPSDLPPMRKHAVFALDTSGSMRGRKWAQTKEALAAVLGDLLQRGEGFDSFSLLDFADGVRVWRAAEEATEESVREALEQVEALEPEGKISYPTTLLSRTNDRIQKKVLNFKFAKFSSHGLRWRRAFPSVARSNAVIRIGSTFLFLLPPHIPTSISFLPCVCGRRREEDPAFASTANRTHHHRPTDRPISPQFRQKRKKAWLSPPLIALDSFLSSSLRHTVFIHSSEGEVCLP